MHTIKATFDGHIFKPNEPVPVKENCEVIITFAKPIEKNQESILQFFGAWDDNDVNCINEIIKERNIFSSGRTQI